MGAAGRGNRTQRLRHDFRGHCAFLDPLGDRLGRLVAAHAFFAHHFFHMALDIPILALTRRMIRERDQIYRPLGNQRIDDRQGLGKVISKRAWTR